MIHRSRTPSKREARRLRRKAGGSEGPAKLRKQRGRVSCGRVDVGEHAQGLVDLSSSGIVEARIAAQGLERGLNGLEIEHHDGTDLRQAMQRLCSLVRGREVVHP